METNTGRESTRESPDGFTLVEVLVAIVVLSFGLVAVTNLLVVAGTSTTVANHATAASTVATHTMERLRATSFGALPVGGIAWDVGTAGVKACDDPLLALAEFHCTEDVRGVGRIHTHWWITATNDARLLHIRVRAEGVSPLTATRSRAEFTTFRSCTNADTASGGCPIV